MADRLMRSFVLTTSPLFCFALLLGCQSESTAPSTTQQVVINNQAFVLELALDDASRQRGLAGHETIAPDGGLLFVFPDSGLRRFWMKDCLTDIDLIFLSAAGRVTAMHTMTVEAPDIPDERLSFYPSDYPAQFALEFAPGTLEHLGLELGQKIDLPFEKLKQRAR